jgi:hypothetical protein
MSRVKKGVARAAGTVPGLSAGDAQAPADRHSHPARLIGRDLLGRGRGGTSTPEPGDAPREEEDALAAGRPEDRAPGSYLSLILQLCKHYGWEFGFYKQLGMRQFDAIVGETQRLASRTSSPERWDGEDGWFEEAHRRHAEQTGWR